MNLFKLIREFSKKYGRSPSPSELDKLKKTAKEMENSEKIIPFPGGGKDKVNPFKPRPEGGIPVTIEGKTKNMSPEDIMDFLMKSRKGKDTNIGTAPKTTKTKPKVDPELQAMEDQNEMFQDFSKRIRDMSSTDRVAERLKDLKGVELSELSGIEAQKIASEVIGRKGPFKTISSKGAKEVLGELEPIIKRANADDLGTKLKNLPDDIDPDAMAEGGRIGFNRGSGPGKGIMNFIKKLSEKSPAQRYKDYLASVKKRSIEGDFKSLAPELAAISSGGILVNRKMKRILEEGNEQQKERLLEEFIEGLDKDPFYEKYPDLKDKAIEKYTERMFSEKRADGGRIGFENGGMSRRAFLKLMGGLASIPVFGKFFKAAKPAAKVAKTVEQTTSGVPAYFPKLVEKIKLLGDDVTKQTATKERQVVTKYKNYEMTEDLTTGAIEIEKTNIGTGIIGDEVYQGVKSKELIEFKPPETIIGKNNKPVKVPAQYDETTARSTGFDGKLEDFDDGLESIDEILEEVEDFRIKKSGGGVAYMLGE